MQLYLELLYQILSSGKIESGYLNASTSLAQLLENKSYQTFLEIKTMLDDDTFDDEMCFEKIERIVSVFESLGSGCGNCHDFG